MFNLFKSTTLYIHNVEKLYNYRRRCFIFTFFFFHIFIYMNYLRKSIDHSEKSIQSTDFFFVNK